MTSNAPSDSESNISGFVRYSDKNSKLWFASVVENLEVIHQDTLRVEQNLKGIVQQAGPLEGQLSALLRSFPKPKLNLPMDTD